MKRLLALLTGLILVAGLLCGLPVSAEGSLTASASATTVTVGSSVSVTLTYSGGGAKIGGLIGYFDYDAAVFSYAGFTGTDGMDANGDAGKIKFVYSAPGSTAPGEVSVTLTLKATAAGDGKFSVSTDEFFNDEDYSSLGTPGKTLSVSATNPTKSGNANLASLKPSKGTLTPKFSPKTTEYTVSVDYSVTSLTLSATTEHRDAKTSISGENSLKVGKNTRTVTVTAPNGTTKKYTVVITREAQKATTTDKSQTGTTTTAPTAPPADALEVAVDGVLMTVVDTQPKVELPKGFSWDYVNLNGVDVFAAKSDKLGLTLLYLKNEVETVEDFYIYYAASGEFEAFRPVTVSSGSYILLEMPAGQTAPNGTVVSTFPYEGGSVGAFAYEDTGLADYLIVYAKSPAGVTGLYVYDRTDGSFQRYYQQPGVQKVEVDNTPDQPKKDEPQEPGAFAAFITQHKSVILTVAAACCGLALLIAAVVFAVRLIPGSKKGKH